MTPAIIGTWYRETTCCTHSLVPGYPALTLTIRAAGGGGFGSPLDRSADEVLQDVLDEMVSPARAEADYGVVLAKNGREVDEQATQSRRQRLRRNQKA